MKKDIAVAGLIYFTTMFILLLVSYDSLKNWYLGSYNLEIMIFIVFFISIGWGSVLLSFTSLPKKEMDSALVAITDDILHELNIPIATIVANSSLLKKNLKDEKSIKRINRIENATLRLDKLYNELAYSIKKEIHLIEKTTINVKELIEIRVSIFQEQKRNPFVLAIEDCHIKVDKIGFEQMIDNLISNAMKYSSKENPIAITLKNGTLTIEDHGIGMSETDLIRIHERYYQVDKNSRGEGIGLALVKDYCNEENIKIHISSKQDIGTTITLDISRTVSLDL